MLNIVLEQKIPEQPKPHKERLQERAEELRKQIKRQEEIEPKLFNRPGDESTFMKRQQDLAHIKNKKELKEIKKELKFKFGIKLPE